MLKTSTKQLLESFRWRRIAFLPRNTDLRRLVAYQTRRDRSRNGRHCVVRREVSRLGHRQHMAELTHLEYLTGALTPEQEQQFGFV